MSSWVVAWTLQTVDESIVSLSQSKLTCLNDVGRGINSKPSRLIHNQVIKQTVIYQNNEWKHHTSAELDLKHVHQQAQIKNESRNCLIHVFFLTTVSVSQSIISVMWPRKENDGRAFYWIIFREVLFTIVSVWIVGWHEPKDWWRKLPIKVIIILPLLLVKLLKHMEAVCLGWINKLSFDLSQLFFVFIDQSWVYHFDFIITVVAIIDVINCSF